MRLDLTFLDGNKTLLPKQIKKTVFKTKNFIQNYFKHFHNIAIIIDSHWLREFNHRFRSVFTREIKAFLTK